MLRTAPHTLASLFAGLALSFVLQGPAHAIDRPVIEEGPNPEDSQPGVLYVTIRVNGVDSNNEVSQVCIQISEPPAGVDRHPLEGKVGENPAEGAEFPAGTTISIVQIDGKWYICFDFPEPIASGPLEISVCIAGDGDNSASFVRNPGWRIKLRQDDGTDNPVSGTGGAGVTLEPDERDLDKPKVRKNGWGRNDDGGDNGIRYFTVTTQHVSRKNSVNRVYVEIDPALRGRIAEDTREDEGQGLPPGWAIGYITIPDEDGNDVLYVCFSGPMAEQNLRFKICVGPDEDGNHADTKINGRWKYFGEGEDPLEEDDDGRGLEYVSADLPRFVRGDANGDAFFDLGDPITTLTYLFGDSEPPACLDALDTNSDLQVDIADPISGLRFLFLGGEPPLPPFPACGSTEPELSIGCEHGGACADDGATA